MHHGLDVDAAVGSLDHGKTKPHASIFRAVLDLLDVEPADAVMVGDTVEDDIEGARALGMRAILVDRLGRHPDFEGRLDDLYGLPAALGLPRRPRIDWLSCLRGSSGRSSPSLSSIGEIATPGLFFLGPVALAAVAGALAALFGAPFWLQVIVFAGVVVRRARAAAPDRASGISSMPRAIRTGSAALVGAPPSCSSASTPTAAASASAARNGRRGRTCPTRCSSRACVSRSPRSRAQPRSSMNKGA